MTEPRKPKRTLLSWSSGKDSAWALHVLRRQPSCEVAGLFCTVNQAFDRVSMHAVRVELLKLQAEKVGLPLQLIQIPYPCSNEEYETIMGGFVEGVKEQGIDCFAFGDLFLEDVRQYRVDKLAGTGIEPVFPLWGLPTPELALEMIALGLRAKITCVDPEQLSPEFAGREFDHAFLADLPAGVDPCGENGEFHSFVYDGPMFQGALPIQVGETVTRDGFTFTDILPQGEKVP
jgi:uncharacterized protein (TIGR00290 family)